MSQTVTCIDSGDSFEFSEGEQAFFAEQGYLMPKRCRDCRAAAVEDHRCGGNRLRR